MLLTIFAKRLGQRVLAERVKQMVQGSVSAIKKVMSLLKNFYVPIFCAI